MKAAENGKIKKNCGSVNGMWLKIYKEKCDD